jgi:hypothetical protein
MFGHRVTNCLSKQKIHFQTAIAQLSGQFVNSSMGQLFQSLADSVSEQLLQFDTQQDF